MSGPRASRWRVGQGKSIEAQASLDFHSGTPSAAAGISAINHVADSKLADGLSNAGKLVLFSSQQATDELAGGNWQGAAAIAAVGLIGSTSYYMGQEIIDSGVSYISDAVGEIADAVPIIGAIVNVLISAAQNPAGSLSPGEIDQKCGAYYRRVTFGNGGNLTGAKPGTILPADLFMGTSTNAQTGVLSPDVFGWKPGLLGNKNPPDKFAGGSLGRLLRLLEDDIEEPNSASAKSARIAWPNAGLSAETRIFLKELRLGMSAGYVNGSIPRLYTPELTDGGTTLWPVYADILTNEFRWGAPGIAPGGDKSRIPKDWLRWRALHRLVAGPGIDTTADTLSYPNEGKPTPAKLFANAMAARAQGSPSTAAKNPLKYVADFIYDNDENFTLGILGCPIFDFERVWSDFYGVCDGWFKGVYGPDPSYQFPDTPTTGTGGAGSGLWNLALLAALGVGAFAYLRPNDARRVAGQLQSGGARAARLAGDAAGRAGSEVRGWARRLTQ